MTGPPFRVAHLEEVVGDDPDAELLRDELKEDEEELPHEIQREMEDAVDNDRLRQQEELMRLWLQQLAAQQQQTAAQQGGGAAGGQQLIYPYRSAAAAEEDDDDEDGSSSSAADESFLGWLRSSLLPGSPSSLLSYQSLSYYSRLSLLKLGQWGWMVGTASALAVLPFMVASLAEEQKIRETNLLQQMDARMSFLEQSGGGGGGVAAVPGGGGHVQQPKNMPKGYVPPPMEASGIPQA